LKRISDKLLLPLFITSCAFFIFAYGVAVGKYHIFPYGILETAYKGYQRLMKNEASFFIKKARDPNAESIKNTGLADEGITLITRIGKDYKLIIEVIRLDGEVLNRWEPDWFDLWPEPEHLPSVHIPKSRPGTHIHGAILFDNGDLAFNFEGLGLIRMDSQGQVIWRLPYQTHHSIHLHDDGNLWVCGLKERSSEEGSSNYQNVPYDGTPS
jgi:hypothetical protein